MTPIVRPFRAAVLSAIAMIATAGMPALLQAAPVITATKDDGVPAATRKLKGDTVTYTNTIANTGDAAATAVQFADPDVTDATVNAGSLTVTPVAIDDVYPQVVTPNIAVDTTLTTGFSVVTNDFYGYSASNPLTISSISITAFDAASANGGIVSMVTSGANVGKFSYSPPAGFTGTDTFTYTISNGVSGGLAASKKGTVSLTVSGTVVWFVNTASGDDSTGKGTLTLPFKTIDKAVTASSAGHSFFVTSGSYTTTGANGIALKATQKLWGQGVTGASFDAVVLGGTPGPDSAARPSIGGTKPTIGNTTSNGNVITLADADTIRGVAINSALGTGKGIVGTTTVNTGTVGVSGDVTISGCAGGSFSLTSGSGAFNVGTIITNTSGNSVTVASRTGGTVAFTSAVSDTGSGITLGANAGATINFTGGISASTSSATAFSATGGGTVSATQDNTSIVNTLSSSSGTALNVVNTTIGAAGLTFRSINAGTGGNVGIVLNNTSNAGSLTVTGNGTAGSGGTIQHKTGSDGSTAGGIGIYLTNTLNPSFTRMQLNDFDNFAIRGTTVNGLTLANCVINTTGGGWNGTNDSTPFNEGCVSFDELTGSVSVTNTTISNGYADNFRVKNTTGSLNRITFDTVTIGANNSGAAGDGSQDHGNDGITLESVSGATVINASILNTNFTSSRGDLLQFSNNGTGANDLIVTNSHFSNNYPRVATGGGGVTIGTNGTGALTYNITGSSFRDSVGHGVLMFRSSAGTASMIGTFANNTIGVNGVANSGSKEGDGIKLQSVGLGIFKATLTGNTIQQYNNFGIDMLMGGGASATSGTYEAIITGNNVGPIGTNTASAQSQGIGLNGGTNVGDTWQIYLSIGGTGANKNIVNNWTATNGLDDIRIRQRQATTIHLTTDNGATNYGGANNDNVAVAAFLAANNTTTGHNSATSNVPTGGGFIGGAPPLLFMPASAPEAAPAVSQSVLAESSAPVSEEIVGNSHEAVAAAPAATIPAPAAAREVTQAELDSLVGEARGLWEATGLTAAQLSQLKSLRFEISDLPAPRLGEAGRNAIRVSRNGGGNGWYAVADGNAFSKTFSATRKGSAPEAPSAGSVDLLTTLLHEMGHALGLEDSYLAQDRDSIMYGYLTRGERRLPAKGQAEGATPHTEGVTHFLTGSLNPITIPTLPPGKDVVITYGVTINNSITAGQISSQGSVSGTGFTTLSTDDPNVAGAANPTITLVGIPPVITSANATTFKVGTAGSFAFTASGQPAPTFTTASTLPGGVTLAANGTLSGTPNVGTGGVYTLSVVAGNTFLPNDTQSFTLTVNEAPTITSAASTTFTTGTLGSFTVTTAASFPANAALSASGTLPSGVTFTDNGNGTATLTGTPAATAGGSYPLIITANNGITPNASQSFTLTVNQAPLITSSNATTFTVGTAGSFSVTTTGFPNAAITKTGTLPGGVTLVDNGNGTATLAGTPNAGTGGTYPITLTANNGVGSPVNQSFTLTVNQAPAITSTGNATFTVGSAGSFTVTTTGFPTGATMVIGETGSLPTGLTFVDNHTGTATLSGTPAALTGGTYPITISASNGIGTAASQSFTLTVNQAPAITSADNTAFTATVAGTFTVTTTGFPTGATMVIGETGSLPSGVTFVDNHNGTATLAGTPSNASAGIYPLTITANNGVGSQASQSFTLTVKPPVDHFTVSAPANATAGTPVNVTVTALDAANTTVANYQGTVHFTTTDAQTTVSGLPANYTFTAGDNGSHTFSVTLKTAGTQTVSVNDVSTPAAAGTSGSIAVTAGADAKLVFVQQPSTTVAGVSITPAVTVQVQDAFSNNTTGTPSVTLALGNAGAATLGGTATQSAVGGVATFNNLTVDKVGTTYNLGASSGVLTGATSNNFTITPAAATHYTVVAPGTATAGTAFNVTVTALDQFNNTATGYAGTVHFTSSDAAATLPADGTLTSGVGTFSATLKTTGSRTITATDTVTGSITGTSAAITVGAGADAKLVFVQQPSTTVAGVSIAPAVTVQIQDTFGNPTASTSNVTVVLGNAGAATLSGTLTKTAVAGLATFNDLKVDKVGTTYNLAASSGILTGATSNAFTITPAAATHYTVSAPGTATAGTAFNVTVTALDQFNNTATGYAGTGHFTSSDAQATLAANGTLTSGVGTFSTTLKTAGSQTVTATDTVTGSITGTSSGITVGAGADAKLVVVQQPSTTVAGVSIAPAVTVQIQDTFGNPTASTSNVTVALGNASGATLSGTLTKAAVAGLATFNDLKVDKVGTTYNLAASSGVLTGATSNAFTITPAAATHYTVSAPGTATAGTAFNVTVTAFDQFNNTATGYAGTVHFTSSDAQAILPANGTLTSGVGTFSTTLKTAGSQTVTATDTVTGSITGTSSSISVSPAAATHYTVSAPANATAGTAFNLTVTALDQFNNTATAYAGTVHFTSSDAAATLPANSTLTSGVGTFSTTLKTAGSRTITATDTVTGSITGTSGGITVAPGSDAKLVFIQQPSTTVAGVSVAPAVTVQIQDTFGNVTTSTSNVTVALGNAGAATLSGTLTKAAVAGLATFNDLKVDKVGTTYNLGASSGVLTGATSNAFTITPAAATHYTVSAPANATAGTAINVTVMALDQFNNTATGYMGTTHFTSSDAAAVLPANYSFLAGDNGVHVFSTTLKTAGNQTVTATDTVTSSITGTSGNVLVDPRSDLAVTVTDAPDPVVAGTNLTYTIGLVNNGPSAASTVSLVDALPVGTTFVSLSTPGGWSVTTPAVGGTGNVIIEKPSVAPAESASFTLVVKVGSSVANGTVLSDTATVTTTTTELTAGDNSATATTTVSSSADLSITVTDSPDPVTAGQNLTYTVNYSNAGPSDATTVTVSDTLPAGLTFVSATNPGGWSASTPAVGSGGTVTFNSATVANGGSGSFTIVAKVASSTAAGAVISNTATIASASTDPASGNNSGTATTTVARSADLSITAVATPDPVNATQNATYTIDVTNNGPSDAANNTVTFPFPANVTFVSASTPSGWTKTSVNSVGDATGTVTYTSTTFAAAATSQFVIVLKVDATAPNNSHLNNTITVGSGTTDPVPGNNSASPSPLVKSGADLAIVGNASTPAVAGSDVTYTFTATNNGPLDADNAVVTDMLPPGTTLVSVVTPSGWTLDASSPVVGANGTVTFTRPLFANGATADFTVVAHIGASVTSGTVLHNGIAASSTTLDIFPLNSSASLDSTVTTHADLAVTLSATPNPVLAEGTITYSIGVTNNGPSDATGASVSFPLPSATTFVSASASGWTITSPVVGSGGTVTFSNGSLALSGSTTLTVVAKVNAGTTNSTAIPATATVSGGSDLDPNLGNNSASTSVDVGTVDPTPLQLSATGTLNRQTGLFELNVKVTNTTPHAINGFRLHVDYSAYLAAYPSLRLYNATSLSPDAYVDYAYPVLVDNSVNVKLLFYTSTRTFPNPFSPVLSVEKLAASQTPTMNNSGVQATVRKLLDGTVLLEFPSVVGHWYRVRYSSDMVHWYDCPVPIQAGGSKTQWIDAGAPFTSISPADPSVLSRYYLVNEIAAP